MGRALAERHREAADVFARADEALGFSLSDVLWGGPAERLTDTRNAQPGILAHSIAAHATALRHLGDGVAAAAGHSLGEFSAHVAAGTLGFEDALRAVRVRGELMARAGEERPGTMAAVLGLDDRTVEAVCAEVSGEGGVCVPANYNAPGQVVISGDVGAVERAREALAEAGAKRTVPLDVSGAFHSPLMASAEAGLREHLGGLAFRDPRFPVVANVTARPVESGEEARRLLVEQLTRPVRWADSVRTLAALGVERFLELGPGTVLTGLSRRIARGTPCLAVEDPEGVEALRRFRDAPAA